VALLLLAALVVAGTLPVALICVAELLVQGAGLSRPAAFAAAALGGLIVAAVLAAVGWSYLRGIALAFGRSREELTRNVTWIKQAVRRSTPRESPQPQER
jgi:hypothetical protein